MRIALIARRFDPAGGGTERDLIVTARLLKRAGHQVMILAGELRGSCDGLEVRGIGTPPMPRALKLMRLASALPAAARKAGADVVVSFARTIGADVMRSGGGAHISYVRAARRWRGLAAAALMHLSPYHRAQMIVERRGFAAPSLKKVISVSNLVRDDLIREFTLDAARVTTIFNGVDLERFNPSGADADRDGIRAQFGIPNDAKMVVFIGNGFARKGLHPLIGAWPLMPPTSWLLVIGADRYLASFRMRALDLGVGERVIFAGPQSGVERILKAADAFAMPSMFEPFGNVVLEAMAAGVPALASSYCGVAELMRPALAEFVVDNPADCAEIARRLGTMLVRAEELKSTARGTAERYTWDRYAREFGAVIESVA